MKKITLSYCPVKGLPWKKTATGFYPENWQEITAQQLIAIACTCKGKISDHRFLHFMTGIPAGTLRKLDEFQQYKLFELLDFINDFKPHHSFILNTLEIKGSRFRSPAPRLKGLTFGQFIFMDTYFWNYQQYGKQEEMLAFLAAAFLREGKPFKEKNITRNIPLMARVDEITREAIFMNYILIYTWIMECYPLLFPQGVQEAPSKKPSGQKRDPRAWIKIFDRVVGKDIIHQDKYAKLPLHSVFRHLTALKKESLK